MRKKCKLEYIVDKIFHFLLFKIIVPSRNWKIKQIFKIISRYVAVKQIIKNGGNYVY